MATNLDPFKETKREDQIEALKRVCLLEPMVNKIRKEKNLPETELLMDIDPNQILEYFTSNSMFTFLKQNFIRRNGRDL
jgi:hypothetical protein